MFQLSNYSAMLIYQYRDKPKARKTIGLIQSKADKFMSDVNDYLDQFDIDKARGFSLDIIGRRVGVNRTLPSFISKGYWGWLGSVNGEGWGNGVWYRSGEAAGESLSLNDDDFRFLIKAKIFKNFQNGSLDYLINSIREIMNTNANVVDNYDMTATVLLPLKTLNSLQQYMIEQMDILPRPDGVMYNFINASGKEFGFYGFFNTYGFGQGAFVDI